MMGLLVVVLVLSATAAITTPSSYGQQGGGGPPQDVRIIEQDEIRTRIITGMGDLTDYKLYPNGTGEFIDAVQSWGHFTKICAQYH